MRAHTATVAFTLSAAILFGVPSPGEEIPDVSAWLELDEEVANDNGAWSAATACEEEETEIIPALAAYLNAEFWEAETEMVEADEEGRFAA